MNQRDLSDDADAIRRYDALGLAGAPDLAGGNRGRDLRRAGGRQPLRSVQEGISLEHGGGVLTRAAQQFLALGGAPLNLDGMSYEQLSDAFPQPQRGGVPLDVLEQCTNVYVFRANREAGAGGANENEAPSCSICLVDYEEGDHLRMLPCLHQYHKCCADKWLSGASACPVCKTNVKTLVADTPRITGKANPASWESAAPAPARGGAAGGAAGTKPLTLNPKP